MLIIRNDKGQFVKNFTPWNKGKTGFKGYWDGKQRSEETKQKISDTKKGTRSSPETEIKKGEHLSEKTEFKKGNVPWSSGKTDIFTGDKNTFFGKKHTDESKKKMSEAKKGYIPWNKGKQKMQPIPTLCACGCNEILWGGRGKYKRGHSNRGKKQTEAHKRKSSEAHKGNVGYWLGKNRSEETIKKLSDANIGNKSPHWKGGISFEPYCHKFNTKFKESIRDKFDRVCFICGKNETDNGKKLCVHHVNYDKNCLCNDVKCEFVPLCNSCHSKTNSNRDYYENMFIEKLTLLYKFQ